jgi:hypothetical protein
VSRKFNEEKLHNSHSAPNDVTKMKSRRWTRTGYVVCTAETRNPYKLLEGKPQGENHLGDIGVDGWITLIES